IEEVVPIKNARQRFAKSLLITLSLGDIQPGLWEKLDAVLNQHPGEAPVFLDLCSERLRLHSKLSGPHKVEISDKLRDAVEELLGPGHLGYGFETNGH